MLACSDSVPLTILPLNGAELVLDPAGALVWPEQQVMVVADLHLEKGSFFARRGQMLPPYDTTETLLRLEALAARWQPRTLIALGDSLHDRRAAERLDPSAVLRLKALQSGRTFIWIAGNHDPEPAHDLSGDWAREVGIGPLTFRHEPRARATPGEVAGHLHPAARLAVRGRSLRRRCFATDGTRMVLPALGAFTGGLNVRHGACAGLFAGRFEAHVLGADRTYRFTSDACLAD